MAHEPRKTALAWIVLILVLIALGILSAATKKAHAGQLIQTPCGSFDVGTMKATDLANWQMKVATMQVCAQFQAQAQQVATAQGEQGLRIAMLNWQMGRADRNDAHQMRREDKQDEFADRQLIQAERNAELQRRLAERQIAFQEFAARLQAQRYEAETFVGVAGATVRLGQVLQSWGH